jgi:hypothetical protein
MPPLPIDNLNERTSEFFTYTTGRLASLAAAATINTQITIQADSDFIVEKLTYACDIAAAAVTISTLPAPNVTVLLTSSGSGQQWMNTPMNLPSLFGLGWLPFILPYPRVLPANSQLQIQLVSYEAAVANLITLNFHGRKVYRLSRPIGR